MSKKKRKRRPRKAKKQIKNSSCQEQIQSVTEGGYDAVLVPYDEGLLEKARIQWQLSEWNRLMEINQDDLVHHPQREKIALLVASAQFQCGNKDAATRYLRLAQDWGCSRKIIAQILISGAHHSLAQTRFLLGDRSDTDRHLYEAVDLGGVLGDTELLARVRYRLLEEELLNRQAESEG